MDEFLADFNAKPILAREPGTVPVDPFEKDASRELDTFKECLSLSVCFTLSSLVIMMIIMTIMMITIVTSILISTIALGIPMDLDLKIHSMCRLKVSSALGFFRVRSRKTLELYGRGMAHNQMVITLRDRIRMLQEHVTGRHGSSYMLSWVDIGRVSHIIKSILYDICIYI